LIRAEWYGGFMRAIAVLLLLAAAAAAQVFEVATIKPGDPTSPESGWSEGNGELHIRNTPLRGLVLYAYNVKAYQLSGGPKWIDDEGYTIVAKLENRTRTGMTRGGDPRLRAAMQALLAERFQLAIHRDTRELPGYALVPAKGGFKLSPLDAEGIPAWGTGSGNARFNHSSMAELASGLSNLVGRPVVDRTEIPGVYDVKLTWAPENQPDATGPSIFTALQEQTGLRLEARKVPVELIVIDKAEKPSEN
jgi:uncharacterized protein (TIGR03435 family)